MEFSTFHTTTPESVIAVAVHDGHELRSEIAASMSLDKATRLREEDPYTGTVASRFGVSVVVHRSRFEVDLNRPRDEAVYLTPDDAWGLDVWKTPPSDPQVTTSRGLYDEFYARLRSVLDDLIARFGGFVLYDIHSYNHRRAGPDSPLDDPRDNPTINLGTGSLPVRWEPVADEFVEQMRGLDLDGEPLDVRQNVRFKGGHLSRWVHENYGSTSCALAIELKKVFMDEWSGELDGGRLDQLGDALLATVEPVRKRHLHS
jgi:N-formylglutamate amidohydrolase